MLVHPVAMACTPGDKDDLYRMVSTVGEGHQPEDDADKDLPWPETVGDDLEEHELCLT